MKGTKMKGKIYLVATPIGNLEDITLRAIRVLQEVDLIAAEDTRHTLKLLNHLNIKKPMISYHRHNEEVKTEELLAQVKEGKNIAIVTDAGTPGISDPGEEIVKEAILQGIEIIPIPGACALINALIVSGLDTKEFSFFGFLSIHTKIKQKQIEKIQQENKTVILYEAPHKLRKTLKSLQDRLGDISIVAVKELTKIHEKVYRGKISQVLEELEEELKGEFVILLSKEEKEERDWNTISLEEHYSYYQEKGMEKKEIIKQIAKDRKQSKNEIYQYFIEKEIGRNPS